MQSTDSGLLIVGFPVFLDEGKQEYATVPQARQAIRAKSTATTPLTGATITATENGADQVHYVTPAGTLATLTFLLPTSATAEDGQLITFQSSTIITALTVTAGTGTTTGGAAAIGTAGANTTYYWRYVASAAKWVRL